MNLEEHKKDLLLVINSKECLTLNQLIALLEIKKYEIIKQLFEKCS